MRLHFLEMFVELSVLDPLKEKKKQKNNCLARRARRRQRLRKQLGQRAVLLDSAHGLLLMTSMRMRNEVIRTKVKKLKHATKVVLRELAQVEAPLFIIRNILYPKPKWCRKCIRKRKYRMRIGERQLQNACRHLEQALGAYVRWAGPDFRKLKAQRHLMGDKLPRLCARVKCGCCCKCCCSVCCCCYCCWKCCMKCCRCLRPLCYKLTSCFRHHPDLLERRANARALCQRLEMEYESQVAQLCWAFHWLAFNGLRPPQLMALRAGEAKDFLLSAQRKLHKSHFPMCERPDKMTQPLVEVNLERAENEIEQAKAIIGPLPQRRPRPHDRCSREHQLLTQPNDASDPPPIMPMHAGLPIGTARAAFFAQGSIHPAYKFPGGPSSVSPVTFIAPRHVQPRLPPPPQFMLPAKPIFQGV